MAIKKKSGGGGGGANWMDTYGDMVTLLLCFFVLLYSISTIDESKWKAIVQSFNPNAIPSATVNPGGSGPNADSNEGEGGPMGELSEQEIKELEQQEIDEALDALFQALQSYAAESEAGKNIEVTKGDGVVYVNFNDAVFFVADQWNMLPGGEEVLSAFCEILDQAEPYIDEVRVMGHTAQGTPGRPNTPFTDRQLSSMRGVVVTVFIQEHSNMDPARLVNEGLGQHRPIASNDTEETRVLNRRVEIAISGKNVLDELGDSIEQYYTDRGLESPSAGTGDGT